MSLKEPHLKMSKSHQDPRSRILLTDEPDNIREKVKQALTDSVEGITYDPANRPGISNLLEIMAYLDTSGRDPTQIADELGSISMRHFKDSVSETIISSLSQFRRAYRALIRKDEQDDYLKRIAADGASDANSNAETNRDRVYRAIGLK